MDLSLKPEKVRKLAADELSVLLYLRIVFHAFLCFLAGLALLGSLSLMPADWLRDSHKLMIAGGCAVAGFLGWVSWKLLVIWRELMQQPRDYLHHTPTFYSWARATQVVAALALLHSLFYHWLPAPWFQRLGEIAWMSSCLMAGFYLLYFFLLALVRHPPPWSTVVACVLALAAAMSPPKHLVQRGNPSSGPQSFG